MSWLSLDGFVPASDLSDVELAVQKAKMLYGGKGRVEIDASLLEHLVRRVEELEEEHADCLAGEDLEKLVSEHAEYEDQVVELEHNEKELRDALALALGFLKAQPDDEQGLCDEAIGQAEHALGEISKEEQRIIDGVKARASESPESPEGQRPPESPKGGDRKAGASLRVVERNPRSRRP